jgi:hypothetical protein
MAGAADTFKKFRMLAIGANRFSLQITWLAREHPLRPSRRRPSWLGFAYFPLIGAAARRRKCIVRQVQVTETGPLRKFVTFPQQSLGFAADRRK